MSSRQLRKLQKQRDLEKTQEVAAQSSEDSDGDQGPVVAKPRVSLFAALGGDEAHDEDEDENDEDAGPETQEPVSEIQQPSGGESKKKKKKKKKKAQVKAMTPDAGDANDDEEDEIDRAIKELNITTSTKNGSPAATAAAAQASTRRVNELLSINPYYLKAANEMRTLFGREVMESAEAEEEQERNRRSRDPGQHQVDLETFLRGPPDAKKLSEVSLRRNAFIQGREHWPRETAAGLTMREVKKAEDGTWTEYAYVHEGDYDGVQASFFGCVQSGDLMRMTQLLQQVPYHVSTLIQVSSIAKQDRNMALAAELYERALFTFGRVTTSSFRQNMEHGRARLDFRRPENRQFWLAGYHYLKSLIRKGTYRTALEWAKLMYTLDPRDPYAMRHLIHPLALRVQESRWLVNFLDEIESTSDNQDTVYLRQSVVLAKLQMADVQGAQADLAMGMKRVPWLYCELFQELNLDTPPSIWGMSADSDARSFWVKLYIYQAKDLWNNAQAIELLQSVAKDLAKVDTSHLPADDAPADLGATRLAYLEGQTSLLSTAPRDLLASQPNYEFDPLPPPEEENIFTGEGTRLPWADSDAARQAAAGADEHMLVRHHRQLMQMVQTLRQEAMRVRGWHGRGMFGLENEELLGDIGGRPADAEADDSAGARDEESEEPERPPGAWPEDDDEAGHGRR
ncbi:hypothetical protein QQX98_009610 [Neonectria punicea]|uniref:Transcription factor 25 n=1 Tax=Neonectria punicea TaxID=979145 RepID=A0ABR1GRW6_9HYPO